MLKVAVDNHPPLLPPTSIATTEAGNNPAASLESKSVVIKLHRPKDSPSYGLSMDYSALHPVHHPVRQERGVYLTGFSGYYISVSDMRNQFIYDRIVPHPVFIATGLDRECRHMEGVFKPSFDLPNVAGTIRIFSVNKGEKTLLQEITAI